jgi:hypothetical protein
MNAPATEWCLWVFNNFFFFFFFWYVWGLNSGHHACKAGAYHFSHASSLFCSGYLGDWVSWTICLGWPWTMILPISTSQVARITDLSHQHTASFFKLRNRTGRINLSAQTTLSSPPNPWRPICVYLIPFLLYLSHIFLPNFFLMVLKNRQFSEPRAGKRRFGFESCLYKILALKMDEQLSGRSDLVVHTI